MSLIAHGDNEEILGEDLVPILGPGARQVESGPCCRRDRPRVNLRRRLRPSAEGSCTCLCGPQGGGKLRPSGVVSAHKEDWACGNPFMSANKAKGFTAEPHVSSPLVAS